ncbi:hypothetical protein DES38_10822 [Streptohalobacillus salinus]|uniref:Transcriptional regulator n=1 Tax=Streptohalobacillus salinus TaxID=621096 RepID=A0A2V3W6M4_9BACI|nr:transcription repressor NadR [Streptohalobacillus salinus]PXW90013.1 hypothetical protein DES38_10822 [Streptohalobacillus salinus]
MAKQEKLIGEQRREALLSWLKTSDAPITGTELANKAGVSRQVIVQDISLLKAKNEPIIATSQGYLLMQTQPETPMYERIIPCVHTPEQTEDELNTMVDAGVTVKNVIVEHPVYGDLEALVMVKDRHDVKNFLARISSTNAPLLSVLTEGVHLHTISSDTEEKLDVCELHLKQKGYIFE